MLIKNDEKAIELIYRTVPYNDQIKDLKFDKAFVEFKWRGTEFKIEFNDCSVWEIKNGALHGSNVAILLEFLLKNNISKII